MPPSGDDIQWHELFFYTVISEGMITHVGFHN